MGIPFYFKKLVNSFGTKFIKKVRNNMEECDGLYLDFNSMIHQCANETLKKNPNLKFKEYYPFIVSTLFDSLINIVNIVRPRKWLYIAIDGMCPRAKMQQQRKRRYMTIWRKVMEGGVTPQWDSNVITPGTDFMEYLDTELDKFVEKNKGKLSFDIRLSKSSERGEGEHKIFDVMEQGENAVIYGLDADLIMLSLISPNHDNIRLLREQDQFGGGPKPSQQQQQQQEYSLLSIKHLSDEVSREYGVDINDYVMLCVFLGNDFVPPLSHLSIRNNGIDTILAAYKTCAAGRLLISANKSTINMELVHDIMKHLAITEDAAMDEVCHAYYNNIPQRKMSIDCYPQYVKCSHVISPKIDMNWREIYYKHLLHASPLDATTQYINGIKWVFSYYFLRNPSFTWYYPYSYSPTIKDIVAYTHNHNHSHTSTSKPHTDNLTSSLQLLLVLPPQSVDLLRTDKLKDIMTNVSIGCCHYFPTQFQVSTFLKTYLWECSPVLPDIDIERMVNVVS